MKKKLREDVLSLVTETTYAKLGSGTVPGAVDLAGRPDPNPWDIGQQ